MTWFEKLALVVGMVLFMECFAWAQRDVRGWRIVAPVWAGVTIVATPVFGGHYGVDVLAGLVMAVLSLSAAPWMARRRIGWRGNLPTTASHVG